MPFSRKEKKNKNKRAPANRARCSDLLTGTNPADNRAVLSGWRSGQYPYWPPSLGSYASHVKPAFVQVPMNGPTFWTNGIIRPVLSLPLVFQIIAGFAFFFILSCACEGS